MTAQDPAVQPAPATALVMINPNTSEAVTQQMLALAQLCAPPSVNITALTARSGAALILDPDSLRHAASAILAMVPQVPPCDGAIVAGFGDPGCDGLRARLKMPVTGFGEAAFEAAHRNALPCAVITTTPALIGSIRQQAQAHHVAPLFCGVFTPDTHDPAALMADPIQTQQALARLIDTARAAGAQQVIVGGGPLARAARVLATEVAMPVIDPVSAAVALALERAGAAPGCSTNRQDSEWKTR